MSERNIRDLEEGIERDLSGLNYGSYLQLDLLLSAQQPVSDNHDEMLFIIQHHVTELWIKLVIHELSAAMRFIADDQLGPSLKCLARIKHIQHQMTEQWSVLATLTPSEYLKFRGSLGKASGFQSVQYRLLEFLLGNKNRSMLEVFAHDLQAQERLRAALEAPSLYDEFIMLLSRRGYAVPPELLTRSWDEPHVLNSGLVAVFATVYENPKEHWDIYETCEELVDVEDTFQSWRFRHLKTVERIIGARKGTGGSSGTSFLKRALDLTFFPELYAVRTELT
ncbi:tryptophan 2,3-dioxygenase [Antricoccus suffuscus]|uniref:Tryptophan 2,3-dioxygenase n=1 Tax=Antricoccus suffuscus TaxID=1629062 RepID=A0A2T0Z348_9ACTN|nr:tryptophan 2,3-dioxygenase family protein [Antricoccus suffuscus]PRZ30773.1 tryptophan 2,3-dioxygenase [Antricoccus suffuscus]